MFQGVGVGRALCGSVTIEVDRRGVVPVGRGAQHQVLRLTVRRFLHKHV